MFNKLKDRMKLLKKKLQLSLKWKASIGSTTMLACTCSFYSMASKETSLICVCLKIIYRFYTLMASSYLALQMKIRHYGDGSQTC